MVVVFSYCVLFEVVVVVVLGAATKKGGARRRMEASTRGTIDEYIAQLYECKSLSEPQVKDLCEKVWCVCVCVLFETRNAISAASISLL